VVAISKQLDAEAVERKLLADIEDAQPPQGQRSYRGRARLRAVEAMWVDLRDSGEIVKEITRAFGVDPRTVYSDLKRVQEHHWLADQLDAKNRKLALRAQFNEQRRGALQAGDRKTAAFITDRLARIDGAYAPIKTENVNINITANVAIDDVLEALSPAGVDQLLALIAEFEASSSRKVIDAVASEVAPLLTPATETDTNGDDGSVE
jgi:DNA-binding transcriptional ArsR family regulator